MIPREGQLRQRADGVRALALWVCGLLCLTGCGSIEDQLASLAAQDPLPYSVMVTGGAFLEQGPDAGRAPLGRTFGEPPGAERRDERVEAVPLASILSVLERARVFVRIDGDRAPSAERYDRSQPLGVDGAGAVDGLLDRARAEGHDLVLVIERLRDGPVSRQGVNGRWPVTVIAWLSVGLGLFIPDHTYESAATLAFSLRDVQSGEVVVRSVRQAGAVDLSLLERSDVWGLFSSILLPPPLVWDDDAEVVARVRDVTERRLLVSLVGRLKGAATAQEIRAGQAVDLRLSADGGELAIDAACAEGLASLQIRVGDRWLEDRETDPIWESLQASVRAEGGSLQYRSQWRPADAGPIQVVVQTLSGRLASSTVPWGERPR